MIVKLNSEVVEVDLEGFSTAGDLLEYLKKTYLSPRDFISVISVNGEEVSEKQQAALVKRPVSEIESFEITTENPTDLSIRTLEKMDEFVDSLIALLESSSDKFRIEDETIANKHFLTSVEALQTFVDVIIKIKTLNALDYKDILYNSKPVLEKEEALLRTFNSLRDLQEGRDWISLADIIEYELVPLLHDWKKIFPMVIRIVRSQNN